MREKHDADMREMRQDMKEMQKNIYAKMDNMDTKIESIGQHVRNMSIVTIIGIAAMVVAVFLKWVSIEYKMSWAANLVAGNRLPVVRLAAFL